MQFNYNRQSLHVHDNLQHRLGRPAHFHPSALRDFDDCSVDASAKSGLGALP